ncbi:MAG: squalene--hopene cyclase [Planctomycetes bacterium]|nr:squalene--hopene cyclase [Planctomycetota bacterium]
MTGQVFEISRQSIADAHRRAVEALFSLQRADGHWCGELQGDSILESEYLLMKFILGQEREPMADGRPGGEVLLRIARYLRGLQRADGGWGQYPGSGTDVAATVKAYFALKLMGDDPAAPHMVRARRVVLELGGAENCASFTNFYLACLGQISWNAVPEIPPEIILLPRWFYFHLSKVSAWSRTMIMPLAIVSALRPTRRIPESLGIDELFVNQRDRHRMINQRSAPPAWAAFFTVMDRVLKLSRRLGALPLRRLAMGRAEQWVLERAGHGDVVTDGLGAIFPPMVYIQIVFKALGYDRDDPIVRRAERDLDAFFIEEGESIRLQPCFSPVWDTGIATYAITENPSRQHRAELLRASRWLLERECRHQGDWASSIREKIDGGAWWFEYGNGWYPDVDDTAMVAMALSRVGDRRSTAASKRGARWLLAMQNDDDGWAAFDRTTDRRILEYVPFADHNAMQDPSCPDITGRVIEALAICGYTNEHPAIRRAIGFIRRRQHPGGGWFGRWGVNYIYGTWQALVGLIRCGEDPRQEWIQRSGRWIKSVQKDDGSFGESASSYEDESQRGRGPSTASQTAWGAMVLQAIYGPDDPDLRRAIAWLLRTQLNPADAADAAYNPDGDPAGSWVEPWFTGTGFPRVFYLRYHLYRLYFPLMAIGRYLAASGDEPESLPAVKFKPKLRLAEEVAR